MHNITLRESEWKNKKVIFHYFNLIFFDALKKKTHTHIYRAHTDYYCCRVTLTRSLNVPKPINNTLKSNAISLFQ